MMFSTLARECQRASLKKKRKADRCHTVALWSRESLDVSPCFDWGGDWFAKSTIPTDFLSAFWAVLLTLVISYIGYIQRCYHVYQVVIGSLRTHDAQRRRQKYMCGPYHGP